MILSKKNEGASDKEREGEGERMSGEKEGNFHRDIVTESMRGKLI